MKRTVEQWLAMSKAERDREAAKVLREKPWKHTEKQFAYPNRECVKCGKTATYHIDCEPYDRSGCPVPDRINTGDWREAMKRKNEIRGRPRMGNVVFFEALREVKSAIDRVEVSQHDAGYWATIYAQPHHYIIAAAMVAERAGG